jgi:hypothetical protein
MAVQTFNGNTLAGNPSENTPAFPLIGTERKTCET